MSDEQENLAVEEALQEAVMQALPGTLLKQLREAQGVTVAEVAQALKFGVRQIEALERDDYESLTGTTFIRGFVRSYARFLKADEVPLLAALEPQAPAGVAEVHAVESMEAEMPAREATTSFRPWITIAALLVLVVLVWFGWQNYKPSEQNADSDSERNDISAQAHQPTPVTLDVAPPAQVTPEGASASSPASTPAQPAATAPNTTPLNESNKTDASVKVVTPLAPPSPNDRLLTFSFGGTSWVEVRDAQQRILLTGQFQPNTQQMLRGRPPFQLVIGNAALVKLKYEDRNIDLQSSIRAEVARLTLDDNSK